MARLKKITQRKGPVGAMNRTRWRKRVRVNGRKISRVVG